MSMSRNWSQSCLDNISDKEKISKGLFPHQTSHQHLEMRYHLMVIKKLQRVFPHQTSYQHLEVRYHLTVIKKLQRLFPHQTSYQHLEVRYHLTVIKKLQRFVSSSNFLPALGGKIPFDGNKETFKGLFPHQTSYQHLEVRYHLMLTKKLQRVCFLIKLLTSTWR